jgi:hypothetical protein
MDRNSDPWKFEVYTEGSIYRERTLASADAIADSMERDAIPFCLIRNDRPFWEEGGTYIVLRGDVSVLGDESEE